MLKNNLNGWQASRRRIQDLYDDVYLRRRLTALLDLRCMIYGGLVCTLPPPPDPGSFRLCELDLRRKSGEC
jgi:hypothetical protein